MTTTNHLELCPMCGVGSLALHNDGIYKFRYARKQHVVEGLSYAKCNHCSMMVYLPEQLDANKILVDHFQLKLVQYISPSEIVTLREKYDLSQARAAKIFGGGTNAFSKWERGEVIPTESAAKLMKLALDNPDYMKKLAALSGDVIECDTKPAVDRRSPPQRIWNYNQILEDAFKLPIAERLRQVHLLYEEELSTVFPKSRAGAIHFLEGACFIFSENVVEDDDVEESIQWTQGQPLPQKHVLN